MTTQLYDLVGFETITSQIEHKLLKRGFTFNIMVVGKSGLGKSTMINTLFSAMLMESQGKRQPSDPVRQTTEIFPVIHNLEENGRRLRLTIIDTPGYGDQVNNIGCWEPLIKYIRDQHGVTLRQELSSQRKHNIIDTKVHCCLYFLEPTIYGLKELDVYCLKRLTEVVNVVPVLAKADTLTFEERIIAKKKIKQDLEQNRIECFPINTEDTDEKERQLNAHVRDLIPFAVIGSDFHSEEDGRCVRYRTTPTGYIKIDDETNCDFIYLRNFLTRTHLQDLIEKTNIYHYEIFRAKQLTAIKDQGQQQVPIQPLPQQTSTYYNQNYTSQYNSHPRPAVTPSEPRFNGFGSNPGMRMNGII